VFPEDAGSFTCVAKNAAGFASSTTELFVEAPLSDHGSDVNASHSRRSLSRCLCCFIFFILLTMNLNFNYQLKGLERQECVTKSLILIKWAVSLNSIKLKVDMNSGPVKHSNIITGTASLKLNSTIKIRQRIKLFY
jgi:hypothetical protein